MIKGCTNSQLFSIKSGFTLMIGLSFLQSNAYAAEQVAIVIASIGKVSANARALARRAPIYQGETINTAAGGKVSFKFTDGSVVTLKENSSYAIKAYSFKKSQAPDTFDAHLIKGGLKTVTGTIGKEAQHTQDAIEAGIPANQQVKVSNYKVKAAIATIGVRGTEYKCLIEEEKEDKVFVSALSGTVVTEFNGDEELLGNGADGSYIAIESDGSSEILANDPIPNDDFDMSAAEDDDDDDDGDDEEDDEEDDDDEDDDDEDDDDEGDDDEGGDDEGGDDEGGGDEGGGDEGGADEGGADEGGADDSGSDE